MALTTKVWANANQPIVAMKTSENNIIDTDVNYDRSQLAGRMLIYSHDTFGLGHLQRCLKIARALSRSIESLSILIATGSPVVHRYSLPKRVDYIKLPSVRKVGPELYESRMLDISHQRIIKLRSSLLLETVRQFQPHFILVDHSPIGMKGEMRDALEFAKEKLTDCVTTLGLRDIIDDPKQVTELWQREDTITTIEQLYDNILIYGDQAVYDMAEPCGFTDNMLAKTHFTGFLGDRVACKKQETSTPISSSRPKVVVTVGGGDGATGPVLATYLKMLRQFSDQLGFDSTLITGPFVPDDVYARYKIECDKLGVELIRFVESTSPYFATADLVISTAGYNSVTQLLQSADRAILIPRVMHRKEQLLRATIFDEAGLLQMIHPEAVSPENLYEAITASLASDVRPLAEARASGRINRSGLEQIIKQFENMMAARQLPQQEKQSNK